MKVTSTPLELRASGECSSLKRSGFNACLGCPHKYKASCRGGEYLLVLLGSSCKLSRYTTLNASDQVLEAERWALLRQGPVVPLMRNISPPTFRAWSKCLRRIREGKRIEQHLRALPRKLTRQHRVLLETKVGRHWTVHGHSSNVLVAVLQLRASSEYVLVTANTHTFRNHNPFVTRFKAVHLRAILEGDRVVEKYFHTRIHWRRGSCWVPMARARRWAETYASQHGLRVVV